MIHQGRRGTCGFRREYPGTEWERGPVELNQPPAKDRDTPYCAERIDGTRFQSFFINKEKKGAV